MVFSEMSRTFPLQPINQEQVRKLLPKPQQRQNLANTD